MYKIECYILVEADEPDIYATRTMAEEVRQQLSEMQPENMYEIVEID